MANAHEGHDARLVSLNAAIDAQPNDAALFAKRAKLHLHAENFSEAAADARTALATDAHSPDARLCLAQALSQLDQAEEAQAILDQLLAEKPDRFEVRLTRARLSTQRQAYTAALADYDRLIHSQASPLPEHYIERAQACVAAGKVQQALHGIEAGLERLGPLVSLHLCALEMERSHTMTEAALRRLDQLISLSPRKDPWLLQRGELYQASGKPDAARADYLAAIRSFNHLPRSKQAVPANRAQHQRMLAALQSLTPSSRITRTTSDDL